MHLPDVLRSLTDQGIIDEVIRPLKSGKEAQVYLVSADGEVRVAKVYKDAGQRSFKQRAPYTEGRRVRNTRDQRAMQRRTRHGKAQEEEAWKSAEVNIIYRLHAHGVRVPTPYNFIDGVLIMELVQGMDGHPAPRLAELPLNERSARTIFDQLLREVIKMLCAGIVHGDLSDYNVLIDEAGPVVIDFPQSVDAAQNRNARRLLVRDVDNLTGFLQRIVPHARRRPFGQEIWAAYEDNALTPDFELTGRFRRSNKVTNMGSLLDEIAEAEEDERRKREAMGQPQRPARRREAPGQPETRPRKREVIITRSGSDSSEAPRGEGAPKKRRRRRRRRGGGGGGGQAGNGQAQNGQRSAQSQSSRTQRSETQRSETQRSETQRSETQRSEIQRSETRSSETRRSETRRSDTQRSDTQRSDTQRSDTQRSESPKKPDDTAGDASKPRRRRRRRRRKGPPTAQ